MVKLGKFERHELVRIKLPPEDRLLPFHGSRLFLILSTIPLKTCMPSLLVETGIPKYFIGHSPNLQFSMLAKVSCEL